MGKKDPKEMFSAAGGVAPRVLLMSAFLGLVIVAYLVLRKVGLESQALAVAAFILMAHFGISLLDLLLFRPHIEASRARVPKLFYTIIKVFIYFIAIFTILKMQLGIDVVPLLTTSAVLSFVLGLALQDTLTNLFAGLVINIEKPYAVGHWIKVQNTEGRVVEISWRTTKIETKNNTYLIIPNSSISKDMIENFNTPGPAAAMWVNIDVSYDVPPNRAKEVILKVLHRMGSIAKEPNPVVQIRDYKDFSVLYGIQVWIDDWNRKNDVADEIRTNLWYAFKRNQIKIPYPIRDVYTREARETTAEELWEENYAFIIEVDFFSGQPDEIMRELSSAFEKKHYGKYEDIVREGDAGDSFFIISRGKVEVVREGELIAELGGGDFFGEMSLLTGSKRSATVRALQDTDCLKLDKGHFKEILLRHREMLEKISAVISERETAGRQILEARRAEQDSLADASAGPQPATPGERILAMMRRFFNISD